MLNRKQFGKLAEDLVARQLIKLGYEIIARNWHCRFGELDLITKKDGVIHFIEVKARRSSNFGFAEEALTDLKLERLLGAIISYLGSEDNQLWQLDLIIVEQRGNKYYWQVFENVG